MPIMSWRSKAIRKRCMRKSKPSWMRRWPATRPRLPGAKLSKAARTPQPGWKRWRKAMARLETRRYFQSGQLAWFARTGPSGRTAIGGAGRIDEEINGQRSTGTALLFQPAAGGEAFARAMRGHWGIENKLHWTMDVCFGEDQSRARTGNAAEIWRSLAPSGAEFVGGKTKKRNVAGKMLCAGWDHPYLTRLPGSPTKRCLDTSALGKVAVPLDIVFRGLALCGHHERESIHTVLHQTADDFKAHSWQIPPLVWLDLCRCCDPAIGRRYGSCRDANA